MLPVAVLAVLAVGSVLYVVWFLANQRHLNRREQQAAEWDGGDERPDLWTSQARCIHCGAAGGLLEVQGNGVVFSCLACGRRHVRETRA